MSEEIKIEDGSGDREFFTIVPNYILNHSTIWDREVYMQMKRIAGENGKCYMSAPKLAKKCGIGKERLKKSIKYLIEHKWIKYIGKIAIRTKGGEQFANAYRVENIWKVNSDYYHKGGSPQGHPQDKGGSPQTQRVGVRSVKGGSPQGRKEEPFKKNHLNKNIVGKADGNQINLLIEKFKIINPFYERLFANTTQRKVLERMVKKYTYEKVAGMIDALPEIVTRKYAPQISTPVQLENKLGQLLIFIKQNKKEEGYIQV